MGLATATVKYILFFFNFLFALSGLALIGFGLLTRYYLTKSQELADKVSGEVIGVGALAIIIIGGAVFVVSFFGCCGAIRESHCMITVYGMFLLAIFLMEAGIGAFLYMNRGNLEDYTRTSMNQVINNYNNKTESRVFIDELQKDFHCCGIDGPQDWINRGINAIPHSCCREDGGQGTTCALEEAWKDGCLLKSIEEVKTRSRPLLTIVIAIAAGELIGIIFSFCLASSIRNEERRQGYA